MTAKVVIGAAFGDEGKGLAVDAYASAARKPLVIRFNGGCQAGHTVQTPAGKRHVFHHVGAGAFAGAPTFLSKHFLVNPGVFLKEVWTLNTMGLIVEVHADSRAHVTTPYDIMLNRWAEEDRGDARHGSCGEGINETVVRGLDGIVITASDMLGEPAFLEQALDRVIDYAQQRARSIGLQMTTAREGHLTGHKAKSGFMAYAALLRGKLRLADPDIIKDYEPIFEGAQGLLLDQNNKAMFPHLTRSNTGLTNVAEICGEAGIKRVDVTYMMRPYFTRHGAGPLPHEGDISDFAEVVDPTNQPGPWQGNLRFAPLDINLVRLAIFEDLSRAEVITVTAGLGVSCLDQIRISTKLQVDGGSTLSFRCSIPDDLSTLIGLPVALESRGPTRKSVTFKQAETVGA